MADIEQKVEGEVKAVETAVAAEVAAVEQKVAAVKHRYLQRMTSKWHSLRKAPHSLPEITQPLPPTADLRPKLLPVKNQDIPVGEGDCTGMGTSCLVEYNTGSPVWLSSPFLYFQGREAEGTFPQDSGCVIADVVMSANIYGDCLDTLLPQTGNPAEAPNDAALADALTHKIGEPLQVTYDDDGTAFKTNLAAGKVIVYGFAVPGNFETGVGSDGIMPTPDDSPSPGGHCVVCVGYDVDADGTLWVWTRNSWGTDFGLQGYFKAKWADLSPLISEAWTA
jgi:hypothetical protein